MLHLKHYAGDYTAQHSRLYRDAINSGQAQFELEWHKLRSRRAVGKVLAKLTTTERQRPQVAFWKYSTSLDLLNLLKANLQAGLYKTKTEIATAAGLKLLIGVQF
jgi:hypothetical protein